MTKVQAELDETKIVLVSVTKISKLRRVECNGEMEHLFEANFLLQYCTCPHSIGLIRISPKQEHPQGGSQEFQNIPFPLFVVLSS